MLMAIRQTQDVRRGRHAWAKASLLSLAIFVLSLSEAAFAGDNEWTLRGFEHDEINALTIDPKNPSTLYVASKKGVFKSTDSGETWRASKAGPGKQPRDALVIDPKDPFILYGLDRDRDRLAVYKSADAGESWSEVKTDLNQASFSIRHSGPSSLAIDPTEPSKLYLIGPDLWVSKDRGEHWRRLASYESSTLSLAIDPKEPSTLYLGTVNQDLSKSTDGGEHWRPLAVLEAADYFAIISIAIDPENSSVLYTTTPNGVHKSTDAGERWKEINHGLGTNERGPTGGPIAINLAKPSTIYAGVRGRVYISTDGGERWTEAAIGLPESGVIKQLVLDPKDSSTLYAGGTRGLWRLQRP